MKFVDRLNRAFVGWLRGDGPPPSVRGDAIVVGGHSLALAGLVGAVAYEADVHAGEVITLALAFRSGVTCTVTQQDACWDDLLAALDRLHLTTTPSSEWTSRLLAGAGGEPLVLRREEQA